MMEAELVEFHAGHYAVVAMRSVQHAQKETSVGRGIARPMRLRGNTIGPFWVGLLQSRLCCAWHLTQPIARADIEVNKASEYRLTQS
jgi:hypothetical protein